VSNRASPRVRSLGSGVYSVTNATLETPWDKLVRGKATFRSVLEELLARGVGKGDDEGWLAERLIDRLLKDGSQCEVQSTGYGPGVEAHLSRVFVPGAKVFERFEGAAPHVRQMVFGTTCHTVVTVDREGRVAMFESSIDPATQAWTPVQRIEFIVSMP
jgi:uncharacterized protein with NRDE domain